MMRNTNQMQMQELIHQFSDTIASLSNEAEEIRCLAACVAVAATDNDDVDTNDDDDSAAKSSKQVMKDLQNLEATIAALEQQMKTLQNAVLQEKKSILQLEETKAAALEQSAIIEKMLVAIEELCRGSDGNVNINAIVDEERKSVAYPGDKQSLRSSSKHLNPSPSPSSVSEIIHIDPVTQDEFQSVCKNIRGRIHLAWVNDALTDILSVARKKYAVLRKYDKSLGMPTLGNAYQKRMHITRQHQSKLNAHYEIEVKDHNGQIWISEQDLRDSCAFFSNESSARVILLILRNVQRLRQVYGKRSTVTYILLPSTEKRSSSNYSSTARMATYSHTT